MNVIFGSGLDGNIWYPEFYQAEARVGEAVVGEMGLLSILEAALGTSAAPLSEISRTLQFMKALEKVVTKNHFFYNSFKNSPIPVAKHLLSLRDELVMSGWEPATRTGIDRLDALGEVELHFSSKSSMGDRLRRILAHPGWPGIPIIGKIQLVGAKEHLPYLWRRLLVWLANGGTSISRFSLPVSGGSTGTDLAQAQAAVADRPSAGFTGDNSLRILHEQDPWRAAEWLAAWLAPRWNHKTVVIAPPRYHGILAAAFSENGIAFGISRNEMSLARPALQVLILAIRLCWAPQDPAIAKALLLLPISPIPRVIAKHLIRALDEEPAVGGEIWRTALESGISEVMGVGKASASERLRTLVDSFFTPIMDSKEKGLSAATIKGVCDRVEKWAQSIGLAQEEASVQETALLSRSLAEAVTLSGIEFFFPETLSKIMVEVFGAGVRAEAFPALAGGPWIVSCPEAVLAHADLVVWWDCSKGAISSLPVPFWSLRELEEFPSHGVHLEPPTASSSRRSLFWRRPLHAAAKEFLAVTFEGDASAGPERLHPMMDEVLPGDPNLRKAALAKIRITPSSGASNASKSFAKEARGILSKPVVPPWAAQIDWPTKKGLIDLRQEESPSSLQKAIGCGLSYTLKYVAKLSGAADEELTGDNTLNGNLSHKVFSAIFASGCPSPGKAATEAVRELRRIVPLSAASLLLDENRGSLSWLEFIISRAATTYAQFLKENSLEVAESEKRRSGALYGTYKLGGIPDQVLKGKNGGSLVMDFKWSGYGYRRESLQNGTALQLALYAHLVQKAGVYPDVGFFILEEGKVLTAGARQYKGAEQVASDPIASLVKNVMAELKPRVADLKGGKVRAHGVDSANPDPVWDPGCKFCDFKAICGHRWKA